MQQIISVLHASITYPAATAAAIQPVFIYYRTLTPSRMTYPSADDLISPACVCLQEIKIKTIYLRMENSEHILIIAASMKMHRECCSIASNRIPIFSGVDKQFSFRPRVSFCPLSLMAGICEMIKKYEQKQLKIVCLQISLRCGVYTSFNFPAGVSAFRVNL